MIFRKALLVASVSLTTLLVGCSSVVPPIEYCYIDKTGKTVIQGTGFFGDSFKNNLALTCSEYDERASIRNFKYLDKQGNAKISISAFEAHSFSEGKALVRVPSKKMENGLMGYLDVTGRWAIEPRFLYGDHFSDGLAFVIDEKNKSYFIDASGSRVIDLASTIGAQGYGPGFIKERFCPFSEGLAAAKMNSKWGFLSKDGLWKIEPRWVGDTVATFPPFCEGLVSALEEKTKHNFFNKTGHLAFKNWFDAAGDFSEGLAPVSLSSKWGFIDQSGQIVIAPQFDDASTFSEGLAAVRLNGKTGYIAKDGKFVISPQFAVAGDFSDGVALVIKGIIDRPNINERHLPLWGGPSDKYFFKRPANWDTETPAD